MLRLGTPYFVSKAAAVRYYRPYGYDNTRAAVERKLAEGEIHIGMPPLREGQTCYLDPSEGRYIIEEKGN